MSYILTLNCGSSSIKSKLFRMPAEVLIAQLHISNVGLPVAHWDLRTGASREEGKKALTSYEHALRFGLKQLFAHPGISLKGPSAVTAVGHRVVHGGHRYVDSTPITAAVLSGIRANIRLAPLHTPPNLKGIHVARDVFPRARHVAIFDTGFHQTIPDHASAYALPLTYFRRHRIRRYGFHGISYRYVINEAARMLGRPVRQLRIVACHLGSGCSIAAIDRGRSIDTSMGFTPAEGLMMRTRTGDLDPGVLLHLQTVCGFTTPQLNRLINYDSGFKGISRGAATMPELLRRVRRGRTEAKLALEMFCYRVRKYIGAYMAALNGCDVLIFTAGIGENEPLVRAKICEGLAGLGLRLDSRRNARAVGTAATIHARRSHSAICVIPTNEELMMARDAYKLPTH
ncbi:MAG: acetate/propionate family kinase [Deltaproteobacteria bacterium]|nr:acetate/propionate family kinase [Deltaproteobacteria bacterium]